MRAATMAVAVVSFGVGAPAAAQRWNDSTTMTLVQRAVALRAEQLADTGLADYTARAHGYLTFLAQLGDAEAPAGTPAAARFTTPPKVVKADELRLDVYWKAPNQSKQRIVGRRDTLLLPTDISYHRDHLGIVQHNFKDIIRLGDGDEVRDVPHPLSPTGLAMYDFALTDSLAITTPDRRIRVYEIKVRPRDDRLAAVIGAVYLDPSSGQVVRMAFGFTRAAFRDKQLEDLSIVLDNALIEDRFWLPRRQEMEIRRSGTWMKFPARGIIRGRWEICCYEVNVAIPAATFRGEEIVFVAGSARAGERWEGNILDSLPEDVRAVTAEEVRRVHDEAREMVRAEALARTRGFSPAAGAVSDLVRVNRVEGLAVGAGIDQGFGGGLHLELRGRYGLADEKAKVEGALGVQLASGAGFRVLGFSGLREVGDVPEVSLVRNSIAAQEFGSDYTDPYRVDAWGFAADFPPTERGSRWSLALTAERHRAAEVHATPVNGAYEPTIPAARLRALRLVGRLRRPPSLGFGAFTWNGELEARALGSEYEDGGAPGISGRFAALLEAERPLGGGRLVLRTTAAGVDGGRLPYAEPIGPGPLSPTWTVPPQELIYAGGPVTGPGYDFHQFVAAGIATQRIEWRTRVPFVPVSLGRFGRSPSSATLAPFVHTLVVHPFQGVGPRGFYPAAGVGGLLLFDAVRVDVARGFRDGRWTFSVDVAREFWGIL